MLIGFYDLADNDDDWDPGEEVRSIKLVAYCMDSTQIERV